MAPSRGGSIALKYSKARVCEIYASSTSAKGDDAADDLTGDVSLFIFCILSLFFS